MGEKKRIKKGENLSPAAKKGTGLLGVGGVRGGGVWGRVAGGKRLAGVWRGGSCCSHQLLLSVSCWIGSWSWRGSRRRFRSNSTWRERARTEREGREWGMLWNCYCTHVCVEPQNVRTPRATAAFTLHHKPSNFGPSDCTSAMSSFSLLYFSMSKRVLFTPLWKNSRYCRSLASG